MCGMPWSDDGPFADTGSGRLRNLPQLPCAVATDAEAASELQRPTRSRGGGSDHAVGQHRLGDLLEARDIGTTHIVDAIRASDAAVFDAALVNAAHDVDQMLL